MFRLLLFFGFLSASALALPPELEAVLNNRRLYDKALNCLLNDAPCLPQIQKLKDDMLSILKNGCEVCPEEMRTTATQVIKFFQENKPGDLKQLEEKYDPEGVFRRKYAPLLGIAV